MDASDVFFPSGYAALFAEWERRPDAVPFAGGTGILREQIRHVPALPRTVLSLEKIEELHRISRSERHIELGAMVRLGRILGLGKIVPGVLRDCIEGISGPQLRGRATVGGNVRLGLDTALVFAALGAQYETRDASGARWLPASRLPVPGGAPGTLLCRIRVPLDAWDRACYAKFARRGKQSPCAVFLAKTQRDVLGEMRLVCRTDRILRDTEGESLLVGRRLPLARRAADDFLARWENFLSGADAGSAGREAVAFAGGRLREITE